MEEELNGSEIPENNIRSVHLRIQAQIESFEKAPSAAFMKTSSVCDRVRDDVLDYQDEPHLSKTYNNHRRILIASELFTNFCPIYAHVVDYEYTQIIRDIVQWEKYKSLSRKITSKKQLELRRERYFSGEAQKLLKSFEGKRFEEINEGITDRNQRYPETEVVARHETESLSADQERTEVVARHEMESLQAGLEQAELEEAIPGQEVNETLGLPQLESSEHEPLSNINGNLTEIREVIDDTFQLDLPISHTSRVELSHMDAEKSIRAPTPQQMNDGEDISRILQILGDEVFPKEIVDTQLVLEETVAENMPAGSKDPADASESPEHWSLPSLEEVERTRAQHRYLVIDRATTIHDYANKALQQNKNINIKRVQVFEGPPRVLRAISAGYLMRTPGYKSSVYQDVRSSKLSTLYNRHLEIEKKPSEPVLLQMRTIAEQRQADISRVRANTEIMEYVGMRAGMHSGAERSDLLVEVQEKDRAVDLGIAAAAGHPKESLIGVPISRIINQTIQPPEQDQMDRINAAAVLRSPTAERLQGISLDAKTSPPWFTSTKENPPSAKYRKFSYVYDRLQTYWSIFENQNMEKCVTLLEFFSFEGEGSLADYLTMLRVVDKMSIQRKLVLEHKNNDVLIRPFEIPYVSEAQLSLKEKEPVF